jgi:hypothetical protein
LLSPAKNGAKEVAKGVHHVFATATSTARAFTHTGMAIAVVALPLIRIAQYFKRFLNFPESNRDILVPRIAIRMVFEGKLSVRSLDRAIVSAFGYT